MPKQQETDLNLEIRKRQLENLKQFIASSLEKTNSIINFMGWDLSKVVEVSIFTFVFYERLYAAVPPATIIINLFSRMMVSFSVPFNHPIICPSLLYRNM